jgi:hypothetical protein
MDFRDLPDLLKETRELIAMPESQNKDAKVERVVQGWKSLPFPTLVGANQLLWGMW